MEPILWQPTLATLQALFDAAPPLRRDMVHAVILQLPGIGNMYDQHRARLNGTTNALDQAEVDYAATLAAWTTAFTAPHTAWSELNRAIRFVEQKQLDALRELQSDPTLYVDPTGVKRVLAPSAPTPFTGDGDESAEASLVLMQGTTKVMRVHAIRDGVMGNGVQVQVLNPTTQRPEAFDVLVKFGEREVRYRDLVMTARGFTFGTGSELIDTPTVLAPLRPDNTALTYLTGGKGSALTAIELRKDAALLFSTTTGDDKAILGRLFFRVRDDYALSPQPPAILKDKFLIARTAALRTHLASAQNAIAYLQAP